MPIQFTEIKSPAGGRVGRIDVTGTVTGADAEGLINEISAGGADKLVPMLAVIAKGAHFSAEARRIFGTVPQPKDGANPIAVVIPTPLLRVTIGFILRSSSNGRTRSFPDEVTAFAWLDEQAAVTLKQ